MRAHGYLPDAAAAAPGSPSLLLLAVRLALAAISDTLSNTAVISHFELYATLLCACVNHANVCCVY